MNEALVVFVPTDVAKATLKQWGTERVRLTPILTVMQHYSICELQYWQMAPGPQKSRKFSSRII